MVNGERAQQLLEDSKDTPVLTDIAYTARPPAHSPSRCPPSHVLPSPPPAPYLSLLKSPPSIVPAGQQAHNSTKVNNCHSTQVTKATNVSRAQSSGTAIKPTWRGSQGLCLIDKRGTNLPSLEHQVKQAFSWQSTSSRSPLDASVRKLLSERCQAQAGAPLASCRNSAPCVIAEQHKAQVLVQTHDDHG